MSMTIQSSVKDKILATPSETSKVENAPAEMLRDLDQQMEKRADDGVFKFRDAGHIGLSLLRQTRNQFKYEIGRCGGSLGCGMYEHNGVRWARHAGNYTGRWAASGRRVTSGLDRWATGVLLVLGREKSAGKFFGDGYSGGGWRAAGCPAVELPEMGGERD
ncbi:hypothetical protein Tco_1525007 [Tanacetum coccineum]